MGSSPRGPRSLHSHRSRTQGYSQRTPQTGRPLGQVKRPALAQRAKTPLKSLPPLFPSPTSLLPLLPPLLPHPISLTPPLLPSPPFPQTRVSPSGIPKIPCPRH